MAEGYFPGWENPNVWDWARSRSSKRLRSLSSQSDPLLLAAFLQVRPQDPSGFRNRDRVIPLWLTGYRHVRQVVF